MRAAVAAVQRSAWLAGGECVCVGCMCTHRACACACVHVLVDASRSFAQARGRAVVHEALC